MVKLGSSNSLPNVSRRAPFLASCSTDPIDEREVDDDFSDVAREPTIDGASEVPTEEEEAYEASLGTCPLRTAVDAMAALPHVVGL